MSLVQQKLESRLFIPFLLLTTRCVSRQHPTRREAAIRAASRRWREDYRGQDALAPRRTLPRASLVFPSSTRPPNLSPPPVGITPPLRGRGSRRGEGAARRRGGGGIPPPWGGTGGQKPHAGHRHGLKPPTDLNPEIRRKASSGYASLFLQPPPQAANTSPCWESACGSGCFRHPRNRCCPPHPLRSPWAYRVAPWLPARHRRCNRAGSTRR